LLSPDFSYLPHPAAFTWGVARCYEFRAVSAVFDPMFAIFVCSC
jgi:hypothetical protein